MKSKRLNLNFTLKPIALLAALAAASFATSTNLQAKVKSEKTDSAASSAPALNVYVEDIHGRASFGQEHVREDLLATAFRNAARRSNWVGDYEFDYNINREERRNAIEFNLVNWRRSRTGMFECTVAASYWDHNGEKQSLGTFHGMRTSIDVFSRFDFSDHFVTSAQDAFAAALKKLAEKSADESSAS